MRIEERLGVRVQWLDASGPPWSTNDATSDVIGGAMFERVDLIVVLIERVGEFAIRRRRLPAQAP